MQNVRYVSEDEEDSIVQALPERALDAQEREEDKEEELSEEYSLDES